MFNRRDFLRKSFMGAAVVAVPGTFSNQTLASELINRKAFKPLPVSCLSYSFNGLLRQGMMDIFHFFETCRFRYGLDAADIWNGMFTSTEEDYINKVHRALEERQLVVPNIAVDGPIILTTKSEDPSKRCALQDRYMHIAKQLGAGFVRVDTGPYMINRKEEDGWTNQEFDYLVKRYRELSQFAYDNGFRVGAENHWGPERCWIHMEKLIKAIDHPGFGMCLHFGNWKPDSPETLEQDNDIADRSCAKWIYHTHFMWEICDNNEMLQQKMNMLRDAGYQGYYSAEHHSAQNEYNLTGVQINKIRAILTNWNNGGTGELIPPRLNS